MGGTLREAAAGAVEVGGEAARLPRGRHGIPHEQIAANQRRRLLEAVVEEIAKRGYASLAVSDLTGRAGVSRATFYEQFADKHDCVVEAQSWAIDNLREAVMGAALGAEAEGAGWSAAVASGVGAALEFAAAHPGQARLILASGNSPSEPKLARDGLTLHLELVALLRESAARHGEARGAGGLSEEAAVGAALSIVGNCLAAGTPEALPALRSEILEIVLSPFHRSDGANRAAVVA